MFKNVASQKLVVFAFDSTTNLPKTGDAANITAYVSKDYGAVTVLGDTSATEMDATNAKGYYLFDLTQGETNADTLLFSAKSSTANIVVVGAPATVFSYPTTGILAPTVSARTLDVSAGGEAGIDWANIGSPTQAVNLSATNIDVDQVVASVSGAVGSVGAGGISASSFAAGAIDAAAIAADAIGSSELAATAANEIADAIIARNIAGGSSTGRTVKDALSFLRNKWTISGTTLTVYDTDDTTVLWTAVIAGTAGADPVTSLDPA